MLTTAQHNNKLCAAGEQQKKKEKEANWFAIHFHLPAHCIATYINDLRIIFYVDDADKQ